jgi:hypothetical protein
LYFFDTQSSQIINLYLKVGNESGKHEDRAEYEFPDARDDGDLPRGQAFPDFQIGEAVNHAVEQSLKNNINS